MTEPGRRALTVPGTRHFSPQSGRRQIGRRPLRPALARPLPKGRRLPEGRPRRAARLPRLQGPGLAQVGRITRSRLVRGKESRHVAYAITSLAPETAGAAVLLELSRAHWGIENRVHFLRDVSFAEDACRVRSGAAPQTLAAFRNTVLSLMRRRSGKIAEEIGVERRPVFWNVIQMTWRIF